MHESEQVFRLFSNDQKTVVLTLRRLGPEACSGETVRSPFAEVLAILDGKATVSGSDGTKFSVSEGDILFFDSMQEHRLVSCDRLLPFSAFSFQFDLRSFFTEDWRVFDKQTLDLFLVNIRSASHRIPCDNRSARKIINTLFELEEALAEDDPVNENVIRALTILLFSLVARHYIEQFEPTAIRKVQHYDDIQRTMVYINEHLQDSLTLDSLAAIANMNKTYYSTMFKKIVGMTVWDYILNARVELAISYLVKNQAEYSITEILGMCGFNNATTFNKTFKKVTGKTPTEYKNSKYNSCFSE